MERSLVLRLGEFCILLYFPILLGVYMNTDYPNTCIGVLKMAGAALVFLLAFLSLIGAMVVIDHD